MADVGIDLGTTNSAISYLRNRPEIIENEGRATTPSAVALDEGEILVGQAAKDNAMMLPSVISVKRHMGTDKRFDLGGKEYSAEDISAMILTNLKGAAEKRLGEPVDAAVLTIPAYFSGAQKEATQRAGELAGLKEVRLLAEPIAAALAFGAEDVVLVYDLGGGTFDVAIIDCFDYKMISLDGDNYLGGDDLDARLVAHLAKEIQEKHGVDIEEDAQAMQAAKAECERVKKELSTSTRSTIRFMSMVNGQPVNMMLKVTREEFEGMIEELIDRTLEKVENAIKLAQEKDEAFTKDEIQTVLLVGGSTYVPYVQKRLTDYFGFEPSKQINPDLAVSLGAAVHTASGPQAKDIHRIRIDPVAETTSNGTVELKGRTTSGATVVVNGGAAPATVVAGDNGRFKVTVELSPDAINEITVSATDQNGEVRKSGFGIRHDSKFSGEEVEGRRKTTGVGGGVLPRTLGIGLTGDETCPNRLAVIIPAQTDIPCSVVTTDYCITSSVPNTPGSAQLDIYEGEIAYAPLNTRLASLSMETAASPSTQEPVEITFQVTEDHLLTVRAQMVNFPDRVVSTEVKCQACEGSQLHVVERTERVLNQYADKLRPEEKSKINKLKQGLLDLNAAWVKDPDASRFTKIKSMGEELRTALDGIEQG